MEQIDQNLLLWFNSLHTPILDKIMLTATSTWFWIPFYLLLFCFCIKYYQKESIIILLIIALGILICDQSCNLIKYTVERYRPSHNLQLSSQLHLCQDFNGNIYKGGLYGFCSSHAANSFCLATIIGFFLGKRHKVWIYIMATFAITISYTRIYLGVHYPSDIVCGALIGFIVAFLLLLLYQKLSHIHFIHNLRHKKEIK